MGVACLFWVYSRNLRFYGLSQANAHSKAGGETPQLNDDGHVCAINFFDK